MRTPTARGRRSPVCPMWSTPADEASRTATLSASSTIAGACIAGAVLTDALMAGVVQLSAGAWYDPAEPGTPGSLDPHGNPNVLTLDKGSSRLAQATVANTALVEVERLEEDPGPVRAFEPPHVHA